MLTQSFFVSLLAITSASPLSSRQVVPNYPPKSLSKGVTFFVNVTTESDFTPSIQGKYLSSIHVGAGLALAGIYDTGRIFYQNGTAEEVITGGATIISDGGTPPFPMGLQLTRDPNNEYLERATINAGQGTRGVVVSRFPATYAYLLPETFVVCNESLPYYQGQYFFTVQRAISSFDTEIDYHIPEHCVAVRLIPECAELNELPPDAWSSHEFARDVECYEDVSSIVWSQYGP